jgi:hypothetical protein
MAEEYKLDLAERMRDVKRALARRGQFLGSHPPYGYTRAGRREVPTLTGEPEERPSGPLVPDPREAPVVGEVFARLDAGEPLFAVAVDLERRGVPTKRGGPWTVTTLRRIVTNPAVSGDVVHRGRVVARDAHPPLVPRDLWQRVTARLAGEARLRRRSPHALSSWCEGLVVHGEGCGRRLYLIPIQGKPRRDGSRTRYPEFACRTAYEATGCPVRPRMISARKLETTVRACLVADLAGALPLADAIARAHDAAGGELAAQTRRALIQRRTAADRRHTRARERWLNGREADAWMDTEDARHAAELAAVAAELRVLPVAPEPERFAAVAALLAGFGPLVTEAAPATVREVLATVGVAVLTPAGVTLRYAPAYQPFVPRPVCLDPGRLLDKQV